MSGLAGSTRRGSWIPLCLALALIAACAGGEKLSHKEKGDRAYAEGDFAQAVQEYQVYLESGDVSGDAMLAQYQLARAYFENEDYPTAAVEFEIFQRDYPRSDSLEAAAYYEALSWVKQSPDYNKDSSSTERAIGMLRDFILDFSGSSYRPWAEEQLRVLDDKLAHKDLDVARFYRRLKRRDAAEIYYSKLLREHPGSSYEDEAAREVAEIFIASGRREEARNLADQLRAQRADSPAAARIDALLEERR